MGMYMCVTTPPLFSQTDPPVGRIFDETATVHGRITDMSTVIIWDGLNVEERESDMRWMMTSKSWVFWKQQDSLSSKKMSKNLVEDSELIRNNCNYF